MEWDAIKQRVNKNPINIRAQLWEVIYAAAGFSTSEVIEYETNLYDAYG